MSILQDSGRPFRFGRTDLEPGPLAAGVRRTLADFAAWRDRNPAAIAEHVDRYTEQLAELRVNGRRGTVPGGGAPGLGGGVSGLGGGLPGRRGRQRRRRLGRELTWFTAYNLGELPQPGLADRLAAGSGARMPTVDDLLAGVDPHHGPAGIVDTLARRLPVAMPADAVAWLGRRLDRLHLMLPEPVVRAGGMGKVIRAVAGVLAIGAYDTLDAPEAERAAHLSAILPGAYALGAGYAIVDDTLLDLAGDLISPADRAWCHGAILHGLATGGDVDTAAMPDHPLAEELLDLYHLVRARHPFEDHRSLYRAAEAMYLAQHRDASRTVEQAVAGGLAAMYDDILVKAGMSRVVANLVGRRAVRDACLGRCLATVVLGQFRDDLRDRDEDRRGGRLTPFTVPAAALDTDPLVDLFAYDAYVAAEVFGGDPAVVDALTWAGAVKLANHLASGPDRVAPLLADYRPTAEMVRFMRAAAGVPARVAAQLEPADTRLKDRCAELLAGRRQTSVDARTFVADRLAHLNEITYRYAPGEDATGLEEIIAYAVRSPGKRLRPAMGMMLAEALGVDPVSIEPLVAAGELFHTASLLLDDLPAQDDAAMRRGRPTAHTVFDEGSVQLAVVAMISTGFGLIAQMGQRFPATLVTDVIAYVGTVLGPQRLCRGQDMDLRLGRDGEHVTAEAILEMYELKTATTLEAALVPLMMLTDRPQAETELVRGYARHAGIVFQIRDDLLDLTASAEELGKDAGHDVGKANLVRLLGQAPAQRLMAEHLAEAVRCATALPFETDLLVGIVTHFANRRR